MAYFNNAFQKTFLATGETLDTTVTLLDGTTPAAVTSGPVLTTASLPTYVLNSLSLQGSTANGTLASGYIGFFDPKTNLSLNPASLDCCSVYIAGSAIYSNDKIGPFHGGYQETNKSKMINPRYVSRFYTQEACEGNNEVVHVGSTYWTAGGGIVTIENLVGGTGYTNGTSTETVTGSVAGTGAVVSITVVLGEVTAVTVINPGKGYVVGETLTIDGGGDDAFIDVLTVTEAAGTSDCCKEFLCGETYNLRVDLKGSPALRLLDHNSYYTAEFYTGCCADDTIAPTAVDSTLVMIGWADLLLNSPLINPFIQIAVQDEAGVIWYAPGTSAAFLASVGADTWDNYVSTGHTEDACAGLIINGAYVDTRFGDCTFQISDFYEKEPVKIYASEVDLNGDPCAFEGICVIKECEATQAQGLGETFARDLILSESYRQNFFSTDLRIREITQGNQILNVIDRIALYDVAYLQHNVPRAYNPTGVFDNDQYLLQIVGPAGTAAALTAIVDGWLESCGVCDIEAFTCSSCDSLTTFPDVAPAASPSRN